MPTGTGNLPNQSMSFSPFAILTAEEMNNLVENIEALADGTGVGDEAITTAKVAPSTLIARIISTGSDNSYLTSYTILTDDGNFSGGGTWTAPEDCIVLVTANIFFENQGSTTSGGIVSGRIRLNGTSVASIWGIGRNDQVNDDINAIGSVTLSVSQGDTIQLYRAIFVDVGTFNSNLSYLTITRLSSV